MNNTDTTDVKNAAKHYREVYGFNVIPLKPRSKLPAIEWKEFMERRVTDEEFKKFDFRNVGIVTGKTSGITILDIDDLRRAQAECEKQGWEIPTTATVLSPRGRHYYLRIPEGVEVQSRTIINGVMELKGYGNQVVAPPSVNKDGEVYVWEADHSPDEVEIAECPQWLLEATEKPSERLAAPVEATIEDGSRNTTLFSRARSLFKQGYSEKEVFSLLLMLNQDRCDPPLDGDEVEGIVRSAATYSCGDLYVSAAIEEVGVLMSDVKAEKVEWLWEGRIPLGKITVYDGDPGRGKSVSMMDLAARVTTGRSFPGEQVEHLEQDEQVEHLEQVGGVVVISAEDGLADTIKPRLEAAGADTSRVNAISTVPDGEGNERTLSIPKDIDTIERAIARVDARLVIIDPLMAFLSGNANRDQDVRKAMTPLSKMAERTGVAVLCIRHMSKKESENALYRGGGSIGIIGAARSGLVVEAHPEDKDVKVLAMTKNNLGKAAASLTYRITTADNGVARVEWGGTTDLDANDLVTATGGALSEAKAWLKEELSGGRRWSEDVKKAAEVADIPEITLRRARKELGIKPKKDGAHWYWELEDAQLAQDAQPDQGVQDALYDDNPPF